MAKASGKWKKAANAVGRKICVALYYMWLTAQDFSWVSCYLGGNNQFYGDFTSRNHIRHHHYPNLSRYPFSYENYSIVKNIVIFDIPVDDLPLLNPVFKRYIRILHDNDVNSTADLIAAYLSCSLAEIKGLGRKFFDAMKDFLSHQHKYQSDYKILFPSSQLIETSVDIY